MDLSWHRMDYSHATFGWAVDTEPGAVIEAIIVMHKVSLRMAWVSRIDEEDRTDSWTGLGVVGMASRCFGEYDLAEDDKRYTDLWPRMMASPWG
jgi:hypothetical protein